MLSERATPLNDDLTALEGTKELGFNTTNSMQMLPILRQGNTAKWVLGFSYLQYYYTFTNLAIHHVYKCSLQMFWRFVFLQACIYCDMITITETNVIIVFSLA